MSSLRHALRSAPRLRPTAAARLTPTLCARRNYTEFTPTPIFSLTETEELLKESVSKFAHDAILPKVREMDEAEQMDKGIVSQLFEQGLMGVEIPEKYGGSEMNFGACIVAIEELARVDPSVCLLPSGLK
jgi:short/branched chain acyl-CoA dehydrogenase